jgi:hypothetical protein
MSFDFEGAVIDGSRQVSPALPFSNSMPGVGNFVLPDFEADAPQSPELVRSISTCSINTDDSWMYVHPDKRADSMCLDPKLGPPSDCSTTHSDQEGPCTDEANTNLMLRNIPGTFTRDMLRTLLDVNGFSACYNFIYLPCDFARKRSLGFAFVNMETTQDAMRAWKHFDGLPLSQNPRKVCKVSWGNPQGLEANIEGFRNNSVMHEEVKDEFKPMLLREGCRIPFPGPTKPIRPPRMKFRKHKKIEQ